ncbi:MAG: hypothetical protein DRP64_11810 [Verrucomicrobia bacterium]|nr:MAG: hypothetical protein DRP64_11810 [Verrucomicrobiota bacterium]
MRDLIIRLCLGSPCLAIAFWFYRGDSDPQVATLAVFPCLLAFALIVFPSFTSIVGDFWSSIYAPREDAAPRPHLKQAETLRFHNDHEAALVAYERILEEFPHDLGLWSACFEIAWTGLEDRERAAELHRASLQATDTPEAWRTLNHHYLTQALRHPDAVEFEEEERASVKRRARVREEALVKGRGGLQRELPNI